MEFSVKQIAEILGGEVEGNGDVMVSNLSKIEDGRAHTLSFLANPKYEEYIYKTDASAVIIDKNLQLKKNVKSTCNLIRVDDAYGSFATLLEYFNQIRHPQPGLENPNFIHESAALGKDVFVGAHAYIGKGAKIGNNVVIYPNAYIGNEVVVGDHSIVYPGARVLDFCQVGQHCTIHSNAVLGSDGFGFAPDGNNTYHKVPQIGNVILEDHVDIGANTTIDRATLGSTIIRKGVKLDNLIQVAHNVIIGENTAIAAQAGIAGSTKIGKNCMIGGQVGFNGHITIADNTKIAAQSGIANNIKKEGQVLLGSPAIDLDDFKKSYFGFRKLPQILKRLQEVENELKELKNNNS